MGGFRKLLHQLTNLERLEWYLIRETGITLDLQHVLQMRAQPLFRITLMAFGVQVKCLDLVRLVAQRSHVGQLTPCTIKLVEGTWQGCMESLQHLRL